MSIEILDFFVSQVNSTWGVENELCPDNSLWIIPNDTICVEATASAKRITKSILTATIIVRVVSKDCGESKFKVRLLDSDNSVDGEVVIPYELKEGRQNIYLGAAFPVSYFKEDYVLLVSWCGKKVFTDNFKTCPEQEFCVTVNGRYSAKNCKTKTLNICKKITKDDEIESKAIIYDGPCVPNKKDAKTSPPPLEAADADGEPTNGEIIAESVKSVKLFLATPQIDAYAESHSRGFAWRFQLRYEKLSYDKCFLLKVYQGDVLKKTKKFIMDKGKCPATEVITGISDISSDTEPGKPIEILFSLVWQEEKYNACTEEFEDIDGETQQLDTIVPIM